MLQIQWSLCVYAIFWCISPWWVRIKCHTATHRYETNSSNKNQFKVCISQFPILNRKMHFFAYLKHLRHNLEKIVWVAQVAARKCLIQQRLIRAQSLNNTLSNHTMQRTRSQKYSLQKPSRGDKATKCLWKKLPQSSHITNTLPQQNHLYPQCASHASVHSKLPRVS